jgi:hypothetical protein
MAGFWGSSSDSRECTRLFALIVALRQKFHSNQLKGSRLTASIVNQSIGSTPKRSNF